MSTDSEGGSIAVEDVLFVAAVVLPLGTFFYWLMNTLLQWFHSMDLIVSGPF